MAAGDSPSTVRWTAAASCSAVYWRYAPLLLVTPEMQKKMECISTIVMVSALSDHLSSTYCGQMLRLVNRMNALDAYLRS